MSFMISHQTSEFAHDVNAAAGAWGPSTSRANFCEEDYGTTYYIAELINSLTNIAYIYYGLRHMYRGSGTPTNPNPRRTLLAPNIDFMSSSMILLGIGSFLFHASGTGPGESSGSSPGSRGATKPALRHLREPSANVCLLRHTLEYVDELSMLVLTWSMLRATYTAGQPPATARAMSVALAVFYVPYSALYVATGDIILQVVAFTGAIALIGFRTHYLFGSLRSSSASVNERRAWRARTLRAVAVALLGYALWNIDLQFCPELRAIRGRVGLPWAWLFEFHGWWHIFTAMGAGLYMDVVREMRAVIGEEKKR